MIGPWGLRGNFTLHQITYGSPKTDKIMQERKTVTNVFLKLRITIHLSTAIPLEISFWWYSKICWQLLPKKLDKPRHIIICLSWDKNLVRVCLLSYLIVFCGIETLVLMTDPFLILNFINSGLFRAIAILYRYHTTVENCVLLYTCLKVIFIVELLSYWRIPHISINSNTWWPKIIVLHTKSFLKGRHWKMKCLDETQRTLFL